MTSVHTDATGAEQQYAAHLAQGRFMIQQCAGCTHYVFPPRERCPHCGGGLVWAQPTGRGVVYSHTTVSRKPDAGGDYNVSLIDLEEGVRMMSCVTDVAPTQVHIDMTVRARIEEGPDGPRVVFTGDAP